MDVDHEEVDDDAVGLLDQELVNYFVEMEGNFCEGNLQGVVCAAPLPIDAIDLAVMMMMMVVTTRKTVNRLEYWKMDRYGLLIVILN